MQKSHVAPGLGQVAFRALNGVLIVCHRVILFFTQLYHMGLFLADGSQGCMASFVLAFEGFGPADKARLDPFGLDLVGLWWCAFAGLNALVQAFAHI
ncbi:MAG: hypothetical protein EOS68_02560 [Mesorhizobium sp.]|nr:MAG: hypothetical protein EOS68_02560 [Mesorhizobium sp.]